MPRELKLFVVDTGPLITLAAAQSLDYLLYVNVDVVIPDAVLHEASRDANRLGAQDIIDWVKAHRGHVEIAATKAYELFDAARASMPNLRQPDLGERAAVEVIEEPDRLQGDERGLLLCEETTVLKRIVVQDRERIVERKYPPAKPGALDDGPLKAAVGALRRTSGLVTAISGGRGR